MATYSLAKMISIALLLVMAIVPAAVSVTYKVGDASEWASGVDYTAWVTGKTFRVGDVLEFEYGSTHSVNVVDKAGYDGCDSSSATEKHSDGDTKINLKTVGPNYFICPTPGHCQGGMKLAVTVVAATSGTPATPSPPSSNPGTPSTPNSPPTAGTPNTPSPKPSAASKGMISYFLGGVLMVLGYGLLM